jgi:hypothetical protein
MTKSEIYYFVAKCLVLDEKPGFKNTIIQSIKNNLFDWFEFISICSENLVLQVIYIKYRNHGILEHLPEEVALHLQEIYELNRIRNTEILRQIGFINTILNEHNIYPLYLKGSGNLLDNIYTDIGERLMGDIDFLVPEDKYLKSAELMIKQGYKSDIDATKLDLMKSDHYPPLYHPKFPADIEIHRIPTDYKCEDWYNSEIVFTEKQIAPNLSGCFVQSHQNKIMLNFIHGQLSHEGYLYGWVSLKDIYDLYLFSKEIPIIATIPLIKEKEKAKAIAYFAFAKNAFGFNDQFFPLQNRKFKILKKKHDLKLESPKFQYLIGQYKHFKAVFVYVVHTGFFSKKIYRLIMRKLSTH